MTSIEIDKIRDYMENKVFATKEEILDLILSINSNRTVDYIRFYLFDLVSENVIHKYNDKLYKFNGDLKPFNYEYTNSDLAIKTKIEQRFEDIELCIWNTSFVSQYLNLMPYDYFTFVETDKNYMELIFDYLKKDYRVLYNPNRKELDFYTEKSNQIILKKLISRAPLDKPYTNKIAANKHINTTTEIVFKPKIEKILVDVYAESKTYNIFSELHQIFTGILNAYCINFQKMFYYAKNRGLYEELEKFITKEINFDLEKGELR